MCGDVWTLEGQSIAIHREHYQMYYSLL
jgi:hypothetical protein